MDGHLLLLSTITLVAAVVNGAIGYGFSSITVPLALLFLTNRVLAPALVPIELTLNAYVLWVNRASLPAVWRRTVPIVVGLLPGVLIGTIIVSRVNPGPLKLWTLIALLPLILLQAAGYRRSIRSERSVGMVFGGGVGLLYATTTISGPPLAMMLNNQGFAKRDFRAGLGLIRLAESAFTTVAYWYAGLYSRESLALVPFIVPSIAIGVPLGARLIHHIEPETFRRVCMSFDAWIVAFGVSMLAQQLNLIEGGYAFLPLAGTVIVDAAMLRRFFGIGWPFAAPQHAMEPRPRRAVSTAGPCPPADARARLDAVRRGTQS